MVSRVRGLVISGGRAAEWAVGIRKGFALCRKGEPPVVGALLKVQSSSLRTGETLWHLCSHHATPQDGTFDGHARAFDARVDIS